MRFVHGITAGDISPDGQRVVLSDYFTAHEAVLPAGAAFDAIWRQAFTRISIGLGFQVEGVCYRADGKALMATSERKPCPVIEVAGERYGNAGWAELPFRIEATTQFSPTSIAHVIARFSLTVA